jgi:hypothetical protein
MDELAIQVERASEMPALKMKLNAFGLYFRQRFDLTQTATSNP